MYYYIHKDNCALASFSSAPTGEIVKTLKMYERVDGVTFNDLVILKRKIQLFGTKLKKRNKRSELKELYRFA
jgi:hypothetical protein